jgi:SAM-dependent methyltransferase
MDESGHKARVREQFGGAAEAYVASATHAGGDDLTQLVAWAEGGPDRIALDVATGGGHTALALAPLFGRVVASDLTPAMLEAAAKHARERGVDNVAFQLAEAESLPFPGGTFDLVACRIAPHHFPDVGRFVAEVSRVLRPGGVFLLEDSVAPESAEAAAFLNRVERLRDPTHVRTLSEPEWREQVGRAGLTLEHVRVFRKTHLFTEWTGRSRTSPEDRRELIRAFGEASPAIRRALAIENDPGGNVTSYSDDNLLLKTRKPASA